MQRRIFLVRAAQTAIATSLLPKLAGCRPPETVSATDDTGLVALRDRYFLKAMELNPVTATYLGGDGYDPSLARISGRLRDWRPEALESEQRFYREIETGRGKIDPNTLSPQARIDYEVLGAQLAFLLRQSGKLRYYERAVDTYVAEPFRGVDWQIQGMTEAGEAEGRAGGQGGQGVRGTEEEWRLLIERVEAIPAYLETAKGNLAAGVKSGNRPDRRMIARDGVNGSKANAEYFRNTLPESARGFLGKQPFAWAVLSDLTAASRAAARAWDGFVAFLLQTSDQRDLTDRFAASEAEYAWRVEYCLRLDRSVDDLFTYGAEQVARYEHQLFEVAESVAKEAGLAYAWGSDTERRASARRVTDYLSRESPRNDDQLFEWYREAGDRAVAWGREHRLFDIPAEYRLEVTPTPPVLRSTIDAAYYPAPPFKTSGVGRFYLSPTGNNPAALRLNNKASVANTAIHEGFPGHDWHFKYMTRHAAEISSIRWLTPGAVEDSSSMWEDSMATEGWALYSEELMAEPVAGRPHGFYSAAERIYELQGQLLRAARVRIDVGIHTGRMSFDEAVDYFTEHVGFYPGARSQAARDPTARAIADGAERAIFRYSKWPTQAITYNLGKEAIIDLREALRQKQGDKFSARTFHERLMRMGTIPAGYYREWFLSEG